MTNHNGVLMMQRLLLAGTLGLAVAQKAAAILDGEPATTDPGIPVPPIADGQQAPDPRSNDGAVLVGLVDTIGRAFLPDLLRLFLSTNAASTLGPSLSSMMIYMLMAAVLVFRPEGLFPASGR